MWCANCQTEVAAEVSPANDRTQCAICGAVGTVVSPSQSADSTRNAEELLRRWSSNDLLDPFGPPPRKLSLPAEPSTRNDLHSRPNLPTTSTAVPNSPTLRLDNAISRGNQSGGQTDASEESLTPSQRHSRRDHAHVESAAPPHIPIDQLAAKPKRYTNWQSAVGQVLAYFGVGILTMGTAVVLMGYFGGPASYAPTGWLITIFGQMLLFIGVITLVSGGMEQTTTEVARRIDALGVRLQRIEQASVDSLTPRPKLPASAYAPETVSELPMARRKSPEQNAVH